MTSKLFENGPINVLESHSECVEELPPKAESLASSSTCKHKIVMFTEKILRFQFHTEFTAEDQKENILLTGSSSKKR